MEEYTEDEELDDLFEDENRKHLVKAMAAAEKAFNKYFDERAIDPVYFDLELQGWLLTTTDFRPVGKSVKFHATHKTEDDGGAF